MGHPRTNRSASTSTARGGWLIGAVLVGALLLAGCGSSDSGSDATTTTKASGGKGTSSTTSTTEADSASGDLDGTQWTATGVEGYQPVEGSTLVLTFEAGQLTANAGCNTLGAPYSFAEGELAWTGEPRATMMACSDELMAQDTWLTDLLTKGVEATVDGNVLTLASGDVTITLDEVVDATLEGTTWTLESVIANDAVSSLPEGAKAPTLTIGADGATQVFTGCNNGSTTAEVGEGTLTFSPMAMTRMACGEDASKVENYVVQVLDGEVTATVDGNSLTLRKGQSGLVFTAG